MPAAALSPEMSAFFLEAHRAMGTEVRLGAAARIFAREERNGEAACAILGTALENALQRHRARHGGARR